VSAETLPRPSRPQWRADLGWLVVSGLLHLVLLLALFRISGIDPRDFFRASQAAAERQKAKPAVAAPADAADLLIEVKPFEGISWSEFTKRRADRSRQQSTANAVLAKLKGLKFSGGSVGTAPATGTSAGAAPIEIGAVGGTGTLGALVSRQEYAVRSASIETKAGVRKMTDTERAELKKRFRELEREFRKSYAMALNDDPELRVTMAFEAEIKDNGYLAVRAFRPKGRYRPEGLKQLKDAMNRGIGGVFVAKDLAGTLIRGESVFVK